MRQPKARGTPIDAARIDGWLERFAGYRTHVSRGGIQQWLWQFHVDHRDLAARILDAAEFFREDHLTSAFRSLLGALPGWSKKASERQGRWRFVAFSRRTGESGDRMLHTFRVANGLAGARFDDLFVHKSDLLREELNGDDTVIFVDDFAGTGDQAVDAWDETLGELLPGRPRIFLVLVVAIQQAIGRITSDTPMKVRAFRHLRPRHNIFAAQCTWFSAAEKARALTYCQRADAALPRGYGNCGVVIIFTHRCPDNTIPILHSHNPAFRGLFPR